MTANDEAKQQAFSAISEAQPLLVAPPPPGFE